MPKAPKGEDVWIRCSGCGHKLMRVVNASQALTLVEIKCHSCKAINTVNLHKSKEERNG